ncbi:MAG TPA: DUF4282 domain-containing protein [Pseudogracilibacillus sp.]|nr:DUF4282 domain-containing protein [Pseudogracilibacillus sp.]
MGKFFKFEKMITPIFIQIIFWLGIIGCIIGGIGMIGFGFISDMSTFPQVIIGLLTMFLGPIIVRIYCEMLIVIFKVQGALTEVRDMMKEERAPEQHYDLAE